TIMLLGDLLTDAEKHGTEVMLVQPPFQHETYRILNTTPEYKSIPGRYDAIMHALLPLHPHASYCNASDPRSLGCGETEFMDSSHALKPCAQKIIDYCLRKAPGW